MKDFTVIDRAPSGGQWPYNYPLIEHVILTSILFHFQVQKVINTDLLAHV